MRYCATRPNFSALEAAARNNDAGGVTGPPGAPNAALLDEKASEMRTEANQAVMQVSLRRCQYAILFCTQRTFWGCTQ